MRGQGPIRISSDLKRFNRDVPGHEFSMSLCNLSEALEQLARAYDLNAVREDPQVEADVPGVSDRLLIATKRKGNPGPRESRSLTKPAAVRSSNCGLLICLMVRTA